MPAPATILPDEKELFARMARGDEQAFTEIFFHYIPKLESHVRRLTKSEEIARDIIHDCFLNLWTYRERLTQIDNYNAYIYKIATNKTYDWLRRMAMEQVAIRASRGTVD